MHATVSSRLSAPFLADGSHLKRYLEGIDIKRKSLIEDLLIHDRVYIPTTDFLTAIGLIRILGENHFAHLLENKRIRFIRTRYVMAYGRGTDRDGTLLIIKTHGSNHLAAEVDTPKAIIAALRLAPDLTQVDRILEAVCRNTIEENHEEMLKEIMQSSFCDFKSSPLWKDSYNHKNNDLLNLPGIGKMTCRLGSEPEDSKQHAVDTLLAIARYNIDLLLAKKVDCRNISSSAPVQDMLDIKGKRHFDRREGLYRIFSIEKVPDFSRIDLQSVANFEALEEVASSRHAVNFRDWFHSVQSHNSEEVLQAYYELVTKTKWPTSLSGKILRFVTLTSLGLDGPMEALAGVADNFGVDWLCGAKSPKFFVDDVNKLTGTMIPKH